MHGYRAQYRDVASLNASGGPAGDDAASSVGGGSDSNRTGLDTPPQPVMGLSHGPTPMAVHTLGASAPLVQPQQQAGMSATIGAPGSHNYSAKAIGNAFRARWGSHTIGSGGAGGGLASAFAQLLAREQQKYKPSGGGGGGFSSPSKGAGGARGLLPAFNFIRVDHRSTAGAGAAAAATSGFVGAHTMGRPRIRVARNAQHQKVFVIEPSFHGFGSAPAPGSGQIIVPYRKPIATLIPKYARDLWAAQQQRVVAKQHAKQLKAAAEAQSSQSGGGGGGGGGAMALHVEQQQLLMNVGAAVSTAPKPFSESKLRSWWGNAGSTVLAATNATRPVLGGGGAVMPVVQPMPSGVGGRPMYHGTWGFYDKRLDA